MFDKTEQLEQIIQSNNEELQEIGRSIAQLKRSLPMILDYEPTCTVDPDELLDGLGDAIFETLRQRYMNPNLHTLLRASSEIAEEIIKLRVERMQAGRAAVDE